MPSASRRRDNESFEAIFRRFKKAIEKDGLMQEIRDREHFVKPSLKRKRAAAAAVKRHQRELAEEVESRRKASGKKTSGKRAKKRRESLNTNR